MEYNESLCCTPVTYITGLLWWKLSGNKSLCSTGDTGDISIPGSGRSHREVNGSTLQYSCLGNPMNRGAWWVTVHGVAEELALLSE